MTRLVKPRLVVSSPLGILNSLYLVYWTLLRISLSNSVDAFSYG